MKKMIMLAVITVMVCAGAMAYERDYSQYLFHEYPGAMPNYKPERVKGSMYKLFAIKYGDLYMELYDNGRIKNIAGRLEVSNRREAVTLALGITRQFANTYADGTFAHLSSMYLTHDPKLKIWYIIRPEEIRRQWVVNVYAIRKIDATFDVKALFD